MFYLESSDKRLNEPVRLSDIELFEEAINKAMQLLDNVGIIPERKRIKFELVTREQMDTYGKTYIGLHFTSVI